MKTAALLVDEDPDRSASSAYYAAFYAVQAVLAARGQTYARHKAVEGGASGAGLTAAELDAASSIRPARRNYPEVLGMI